MPKTSMAQHLAVGLSAIALFVAMCSLVMSLHDSLDGDRRNIRYVEDDRAHICFAYQYNVGIFVLECDRIPAALLEHKR